MPSVLLTPLAPSGPALPPASELSFTSTILTIPEEAKPVRMQGLVRDASARPPHGVRGALQAVAPRGRPRSSDTAGEPLAALGCVCEPKWASP
eukprot:scaffold60_cov382-Prasinococcus_capsulatus_cf.AAC.9